MTLPQAALHGPDTEYPLASLLRASDRARLIVQLVMEVWDTVLGLPLLPREEDPAPGEEHVPCPAVAGTVRITGAWDGIVAMSGPARLAGQCGAVLFGRHQDELTPAEVMDAWGELVNMVGGQVKALVPPVSRLSLPEVAETDGARYRAPGYRVLNQLTFACLGSRMRVTVLRRD